MRPHRILWGKLNQLSMTLLGKKIGFVVAGTVKGGTTALYGYLRAHPEVGMSSIKEVNFFDNDNFFLKPQPPYHKYHKNFSDVLMRKILGEATPNYMYSPQAPRRLQEYNPQIKIIVSLRNPTGRAYSQWNHARQQQREALSFSAAIDRELAGNIEAPGEHNYIQRGFYAEQLERIWEFFPKEQTLIFKNEDLRRNHVEILNRVFRFIGVKEFQNIPAWDNHSRTYGGPISESDKKRLQEIYRPEIKKLERLLNWDCSQWLAD